MSKFKSVKKFPGIFVYETLQDKTYYIRYKNLQGKTITEKIGRASEGITPQQAQLIRNERVKSIRLGDEVITIQEKRKVGISFEDFFYNYYLPNNDHKKQRTVKLEEQLYRLWIKPIIGRKAVKDITAFDLERIKKYVKDHGRSKRTANYCIAVVRQVFNKAIQWDMFKGVNPATKVKMEKLNNQRLRFLTPTEAKMLLDELKKRSVKTYEIAVMSLFTGMRAGEIFNLKFGDIDLENDIIHIKNPKNKEDRVAYITDEVREILAPKKGKPNELVFKSKYGKRINHISSAFNRAVDKLGLNDGVEDRKDKVVFHTLRHTFASWLVLKGVPLYTVSKLMGHKSIEMTERYSHLSPDTKRYAVESITGMLDNKVVQFKKGSE